MLRPCIYPPSPATQSLRTNVRIRNNTTPPSSPLFSSLPPNIPKTESNQLSSLCPPPLINNQHCTLTFSVPHLKRITSLRNSNRDQITLSICAVCLNHSSIAICPKLTATTWTQGAITRQQKCRAAKSKARPTTIAKSSTHTKHSPFLSGLPLPPWLDHIARKVLALTRICCCCSCCCCC